ncbi:hypothetical protein ACFQL0_00985 [Haloplanus litoreus]|uniref:hypothetical protein n=1 Tax=Haloplanus litoreus TaxID=767515 RepID=UPI003610CF28
MNPRAVSSTAAVQTTSPSGFTRRTSPASPGTTRSPSGVATGLAFAAVWSPVFTPRSVHSTRGSAGTVASG